MQPLLCLLRFYQLSAQKYFNNVKEIYSHHILVALPLLMQEKNVQNINTQLLSGGDKGEVLTKLVPSDSRMVDILNYNLSVAKIRIGVVWSHQKASG